MQNQVMRSQKEPHCHCHSGPTKREGEERRGERKWQLNCISPEYTDLGDDLKTHHLIRPIHLGKREKEGSILRIHL